MEIQKKLFELELYNHAHYHPLTSLRFHYVIFFILGTEA